MPSDHQFHHRRPSTDSSTPESPPTTPTESPIPNTRPSSSPTSPSTSTSSPPTVTITVPIPIPPKPLKRKRTHPSFTTTLHTLATTLTPLVNTETGHAHPDFPATHLAFHLLTSDQLDRLARHYHQIWPAVPATTSYPYRIRPWVGVPDESCIDVDTKRARFGHFIGMRGFADGVHSGMPVREVLGGLRVGGRVGGGEEGVDADGDGDRDWEVEVSITVSEEEEEEVLEWMAREWEGALREAREHDYGFFRKFQ